MEKEPLIKTLEKKHNNKQDYKNIFTIFSLLFVIAVVLFSIYKKLTNTINELEQKVEIMGSQLEKVNKKLFSKKIGIAIIFDIIYGNGIGRVLTLLSRELAKTEKYDIYFLTKERSTYNFPLHRDVKQIILSNVSQEVIENFDKKHNVDFYILNNDISEHIYIYKNLGKKVIGIFHGAFLSCIFTNHVHIYKTWYQFDLFDAFVHIVPDDYWVYDKLNFDNTIYIPNLYTFSNEKVIQSKLNHKNVLIVGRIDDIIKGAQYAFLAMREVINQIPDAELLIASLFYPVELQNLAKQLQIENNVKFLGYQRDIEKVYSNVSVLLVSSLSESFPMVTNEGKYFGLPIVAFDLEYCPPFKKGVITVNMFDYKAMANEIVKLLSDYEYRREKGLEAKQSLDMFNNTETIKIWDDLFKSLLDGNSAFQKLRQKSRDKYYDKNNAEISIKKHYLYAQEFNIYMKCHKFEDFMNLDYMKDLTTCPIE